MFSRVSSTSSKKSLLDSYNNFFFNFCTHFLGYNAGRIKVDNLAYRCHYTQSHKFFNYIAGCCFKSCGKFADCDFVRNLHFKLSVSCLFKLKSFKALCFGFNFLFAKVVLLSVVVFIFNFLFAAGLVFSRPPPKDFVCASRSYFSSNLFISTKPVWRVSTVIVTLSCFTVFCFSAFFCL